MPTYEYACTSCGHHLEVHQSFTDEPLSACPDCQGSLRKVFGSVGIVLKGSGFYRTDSRPSSTSRSDGARADGANGKDGGSSTESTSSTTSNGSSNGTSDSSPSASTASKSTAGSPAGAATSSG